MLIGIDIVDINRMKTAVERTPHFLERVFTQQELDYCMKKQNPYPSLAVRFAAREALRKVDYAFISGIAFHDVEVVLDLHGKPELILHEKAALKAREAGIEQISISLSHSQEQAIAAVIAYRR